MNDGVRPYVICADERNTRQLAAEVGGVALAVLGVVQDGVGVMKDVPLGDGAVAVADAKLFQRPVSSRGRRLRNGDGLAVDSEVFGRDLILRYESVMFLNRNSQTRFCVLECKDGDVILIKLRCDRATDEIRELILTHRVVLLNLDNAYSVFATLRLHWEHMMSPASIDPDVQLISLNLAHPRNCCPKMVLQRVARNSREYVEQAVIPQFCQECLFVAQTVLLNYSRCRIRTLTCAIIGAGTIAAVETATKQVLWIEYSPEGWHG